MSHSFDIIPPTRKSFLLHIEKSGNIFSAFRKEMSNLMSWTNLARISRIYPRLAAAFRFSALLNPRYHSRFSVLLVHNLQGNLTTSILALLQFGCRVHGTNDPDIIVYMLWFLFIRIRTQIVFEVKETRGIS